MDKKIDEAATLRTLVARYRENRAKVPLQTLKTKYAAAYHQLKIDMLEVAYRIVFRPPPWMWDAAPSVDAWKLMVAVFRKSISTGKRKELKTALFSRANPEEAVRVARAMNEEAVNAWVDCLASTWMVSARWDNSGEVHDALLYSPILRAYMDESGGGRLWRRPRDGEGVPDCGDVLEQELARYREWMPGGKDEARA